MSTDAPDRVREEGEERQVVHADWPAPDARTEARAEARLAFGEAIYSLWNRENPDLTIKEIAKRSGLSPTTVSDIVHGKRFPKRELAQRIVTAIGADFGEISQLWHALSASVHHAVPVTPAGVQDRSISITFYEDNSEFYAAARQSILTTTRQIRVTYGRQFPPSEVSSPEAVKYFSAVLDWAGQPGARSVKRIFGVPAADSATRRSILDYLRQHETEIEQKGLRNYQARVFEYTAAADLLNMALFDHEVAFLAVSGHHPQDLYGMRVDSGKYTNFLIGHFDQLLPGCQPLGEFLENLLKKG
jgi:transcriptional regulator with XRE-family HTH domain